MEIEEMPNEGGQDSFDPSADPEEQQHLLSVLDSFRSYRRMAHFNGTHVRRQAFYSLPSEHWGLLSKPPFSILDSLSKMDDLIDSNAELAEAIFMAGFRTFMAPKLDSEWVASIVPERFAHDEYKVYSIVLDHLNVKTTQNDLEKARSCVNQFYREWSAEGAVERLKCFDPVVNALNAEYGAQAATRGPDFDQSDLKILVPGAGLGRLVFDICRMGFSVEGNEISYHELFASSLALNHTKKAGEFSIAPFALNCSNHVSRRDQFQTFRVPDIHPGTEMSRVDHHTLQPSERMSMSTGDFCVIYNEPEARGTFDAIATVFFIDTAPNIIRYIEAVRNCLKPGGLWINIGPLLWHHASRSQSPGEDRDRNEVKNTHSHAEAGIADPGSVELTDEEVVALVGHFGFVVEKHETGQFQTGYISNPRSMLQSNYRPSFWIARKESETKAGNA